MLAHRLDFVKHRLGPERLKTLLLRLVVGGLFVLLREALLNERLPHVGLLALDVEELKHLAFEEGGGSVEGAVPGLNFAHDAETSAAANLRNEVGVVDVRPVVALRCVGRRGANGGGTRLIRFTLKGAISVHRRSGGRRSQIFTDYAPTGRNRHRRSESGRRWGRYRLRCVRPHRRSSPHHS